MLGGMIELPAAFGPTRDTLHRIATHVLGRRRSEVSGRFGLRTFASGIATPAFGDEPEVLRLSRTALVRERGAAATHLSVPGTTLRQLAAFVDTDLQRPFSVGHETVPVGDADAVLELDLESTRLIGKWFGFGWEVLDTVVSTLPTSASPATTQLWPEHFDAATTVLTNSGTGVNLGFSPGDGFEAQPYAYVGPHDGARGGDPSFWNAPFGAVLTMQAITGAGDPFATVADFLRTGLRHAGSEPDV